MGLGMVVMCRVPLREGLVRFRAFLPRPSHPTSLPTWAEMANTGVCSPAALVPGRALAPTPAERGLSKALGAGPLFTAMWKEERKMSQRAFFFPGLFPQSSRKLSNMRLVLANTLNKQKTTW